MKINTLILISKVYIHGDVKMQEVLGCAAACRESFRVFTFITCFMTQPAGRCTYCQSKARYSWNIFQKISPYKPKRNPVCLPPSHDEIGSPEAPKPKQKCLEVSQMRFRQKNQSLHILW